VEQHAEPDGDGDHVADEIGALEMFLGDQQPEHDRGQAAGAEPAHRDLVDQYRARPENLIDAEIGSDTRAWVTERPRLLGWPTWHGDDMRPATLAHQGR